MSVNTLSAPIVASRKEEALWMLDRLVPSSGVNNLTMAVQAEGALGEWELGETLAALLRRHAVLRTVFRATAVGLIKQVVDASVFAVGLQILHSAPERLDAELSAFTAAPFAFDGEPLIRAAHVASDEGDIFLLVAHHLIFDTLSADILMREFAELYDAISEGLESPPELSGPAVPLVEPSPGRESLEYWRNGLRGFDPSGLDLWCGEADIAEPTLTGGHLTRRLSDRARAAVRSLQRDLRTPEAVVLLAAYALLLARHGAGPDLVLGSPVSVRPPDAANAVGYHINTLPLRLRVDLADGFGTLAAQAREVFLGALSHADVPVDLMFNEVRAGRTASWRNPVFKHVFNYVPDSGDGTVQAGDLRVRRRVVENGFSKFDLEFFFISSADALHLRVAHYTEVLGAQDAALLAERYEALLVELGERHDRPLGEIPVFCERDRAVIEAANDTARALRAPTVLHRIAEIVAERPDATAVEDGDRRVTYAELWHAALATRDALREAGVARDSVVALLCERGTGLAAAVLGVWLAGAAYLPLDPQHPEKRLAFQLDDSGAGVIVADEGVPVPPARGRTVLRPHDGRGPAAGNGAGDPLSGVEPPEPGSRAYLIYTSGSTGLPKGTEIRHHSLANLVEHFADELRTRPDEAALWLTTFSFDISALELLLPLSTGGRVAVCPDAARVDGRLLPRFLREHAIDVVQATPTTWRMVIDGSGGALAGLRVLSGGEPLPPALAERLVATGCELRNVYGPTETTIWSASGLITGREVNVGTPVANTQVFVTAPDGGELPVGLRGELCIAGDGVAVGYHGRPELTAERFITHPRHGRSYRTGDLARWRHDGSLEVLGRLDRQVKVRGHRIELGEIEAALAGHPEVGAAAALVCEGPELDGVLVGFVVPRAGAPSEEDLWRHAVRELPRSSVPGRFFVVDALPTTGNDKVDYRALARLAGERASAGPDTAPEAEADTADDPLVALLVTLWREFLGRADITPSANFFAHGGHSVLGAQLVQRIEETRRVRLKLGDLFDHPTPAEFAQVVELADGRDAPEQNGTST